jgi:Flp pilus assembly pilin Flp
MAPSDMPNDRLQLTRRRLRGDGLAPIAKLARSRSGITALEYAFIAGLVAIAIVSVVTTLGTTVSGVLYGAILNGF